MRKSALVCLVFVMLLGTAFAESDGSRTRAVHLFPLLDENGQKIIPDAENPPPLSTRATCGQCHDYSAIQQGWHFSTGGGDDSGDAFGKDGRPGEPWVLVDDETGTQIPVSVRDWPGAWKPEALGLTAWDMEKLFGRHSPGSVEEEMDPDHAIRWAISGQPEINCLACHNAAPNQNMSEWVVQLARENYRWAATAASELAIVDGMASRLPDSYDPYDGANPDNIWRKPPGVFYDLTRFDRKNRVFLDVTKRPPDNRCYFCHSAQYLEQGEPVQTLDVHHGGGIACTDCHTNGIDHRIARGYEDGSQSSCRGCHIQDGSNSHVGRFGAPIAAHKGLPESHFEKLACTVCHSGLRPEQVPGRVRTSRANRLGVHGKARWDTDLPYIASPVFVRQNNGVIAPQNVLWPAFWGQETGDAITPLPLDAVRPVVAQVLAAKRAALGSQPTVPEPAAASAEPESEEADEAGMDEATDASTGEEATSPEENAGAPVQEELQPAAAPPIVLEASDIGAVLAALAQSEAVQGTPVYVSGGLVYTRDAAGAVQSRENAVAAPYTWALAHDVRPAGQALGAGGCTDCHSEGSAFFYGQVTPVSPLATGAVAASMYQLEKLDPALVTAWAEAQHGHRYFVIAGWVLAGLLGLILLRYGLHGLERMARAFVAHASDSIKRR